MIFWGFWTWSEDSNDDVDDDAVATDDFELRFIFELELRSDNFEIDVKFVTELKSVTELDTPELDIEFKFKCDDRVRCCSDFCFFLFFSLQLILACGLFDFELFGTVLEVDVCSKIGLLLILLLLSFIVETGEFPLDVNGEDACEDGTDDVGEESDDVVVVVVISFSDWLDKIPELLDVSESVVVFLLLPLFLDR